MKVKFLRNIKNLKDKKEPFIQGKSYELDAERAKKAIDLGYAEEVKPNKSQQEKVSEKTEKK